MSTPVGEVPEAPWSKSSLSTLLEGCSLQWALEKVYNLPTDASPALVVGRAVHAALEAHERARICQLRAGEEPTGMQLAAMCSLARAKIFAEADELPEEQWDLHDTDLGAAQRTAEAALGNWYDTPVPDGQPGEGASLRDRLMGWRPVSVEPYVHVPHEATRRGVAGYIDWVGYDHHTGAWVVVDHKTASSWNWWQDAKDHALEAAAYVSAAQVSRRLPATGTVRMEWHIARKRRSDHARFQGVRVIATELDAATRRYFAESLTRADEIADSRGWQPNPDWTLCSEKYCSFWDGCRGGEGHLAEPEAIDFSDAA